jgi:hypothetical protein
VFKSIQDVLKNIPVKEITGSNLLHDIMTLKDGDNFVVSEEDRNVMWQYGESFVYILIDYVHHTRSPKTRRLANGERQAVYCKQFLPFFDIRSHCKTWSVDLSF